MAQRRCYSHCMRAFELWPNPEINRVLAYTIDLDSIVTMSEAPTGEWHVDFSSGNFLNLTEDEYDQMLAAWKGE
jgi:hypothetical protein